MSDGTVSDSNKPTSAEMILGRVFWALDLVMVLLTVFAFATIIGFLVVLIGRGPDNASANFVGNTFVLVLPLWIATATNTLAIGGLRSRRVDPRIWIIIQLVVDVGVALWYANVLRLSGINSRLLIGEGPAEMILWVLFIVFLVRVLVDVVAVFVAFGSARRAPR